MRHRSKGFLLTDLLFALAVASVLLMAMTAAFSALERGERRLARARIAARQLEEALWTLQTGGTPQIGISVERLPTPAPPADGRVWVRVSMASGDSSPRPALIGLVPAVNVPGGAL
jgi:type II secretory pathway pseudopilin PulG